MTIFFFFLNFYTFLHFLFPSLFDDHHWWYHFDDHHWWYHWHSFIPNTTFSFTSKVMTHLLCGWKSLTSPGKVRLTKINEVIWYLVTRWVTAPWTEVLGYFYSSRDIWLHHWYSNPLLPYFWLHCLNIFSYWRRTFPIGQDAHINIGMFRTNNTLQARVEKWTAVK